MFNKPMSMFYVDLQGNLLSNMKLAFYEKEEESGFFTKMFSSDDDKPMRETLVKAYQVIQEIYDDLLMPVRLKQSPPTDK